MVNLELADELSLKAQDKSRAIVRNDSVRKTMVAKNAIKKEPSNSGGIKRFNGRDEIGIAGGVVDDNPKKVIANKERKLDNVVYGTTALQSEWNTRGLEEPKWLMLWGFDITVLVTCTNVHMYVPSDSQPGVAMLDHLKSHVMTGH